jgi:threonine/homoserine/homoserine lactone efflux protein
VVVAGVPLGRRGVAVAMLAWKIASAPPPGEGGRGRVLGFFGAMAFQWINPKAWLIAIAAAGEYLSLRAIVAESSWPVSSWCSWLSACPA